MKEIRDMFSYILPYKGRVALNVICNILMVLFSVFSIALLIPFLEILSGEAELITVKTDFSFWDTDTYKDAFGYYSSQIIIEQGENSALKMILGVFLLSYFFRNILRYLSLFFITPARNGIVRDIRQQMFEKTMALPIGFFNERRKGDIISRVSNDVHELQWSILHMVEVVIREPLTILGSLAIMLSISTKLTIFVLLLLVVSSIMIGAIGRALKRQSSEAQSKLGVLMSLFEQGLSGLKVVKAFNAEDYQIDKFLKVNNDHKNVQTRLLWRRDISSPLTEFLGIGIFAILILYGFDLMQQGEIEYATFIVFILTFFYVTEPAKKLSNAYYNIRKGLAAFARVNDIIQQKNTIVDKADAKPIKSFHQHIQFENVSFAYTSEGETILKNVNLEVPKGKVIALVGPSGGGKSTLVDLIGRFHDVTDGAIKLDGHDLRDLKLHDLRQLFGLVTQEPILFNDTIYNNITFGYKDVTEEQVIKAAKIANAHDFIMETESGYETNIGDNGTKLSGGQRQRLTIARAILRDPPILILDEATSALDSKSEKLVQQSIQQVMENRTAIIIAHRLSTIQHADEIVVLKEGQIVEKGSHEVLMQKAGDYQKLVKMQLF